MNFACIVQVHVFGFGFSYTNHHGQASWGESSFWVCIETTIETRTFQGEQRDYRAEIETHTPTMKG